MAQTQNNGDPKVLSVAWYKVTPPFYGGQKAVALFNEYLGRQLPLTCLCSKNNVLIPASYKIINDLPTGKIQFLSPLCWLKIIKLARKGQATHLVLEFPYYGIAGVLCQKLLKIKLVVNTHNIEYLRFGEQTSWWAPLLRLFEQWSLRQADRVFFKSNHDKEWAQNNYGLNPAKLSFVPFGVQGARFSKTASAELIRSRHAIKPGEKIFLFGGTLDYLPNATALQNIYQCLVPQLDKLNFAYKILVTGRNRNHSFQHLKALQNTKILVLNEVDDISTYMSGADVFINPVMTGGGVQTKTIEALAFHTNVVCFNNGLSAIKEAEDKITAVPTGDWQLFAAACKQSAQFSAPTPKVFYETYHWESITANVVQLFKEDLCRL